jgi:cell wall-associated NlpC family hydrolase
VSAPGAIIVAEARRWLGVRYHPGADLLAPGDKGGVDCAMLLVRVFCDLGLVPNLDPRPYPPDWHLHRGEERFLGWITDRATRVDAPQPGDVALFRYGRCVSHGGIVDCIEPDITMIHASLSAGVVERAEIRAWPDRLVGYWRVNT